MKPLNEYQFNEWRPHIYEQVATYGAPGMSENTMTEMYKRGEGKRVQDSLTQVKTGKYGWEWHNPARKEISLVGRGTQTRDFGSRREAHGAAMDFMLDKAGSIPNLSNADGGVMPEDTVSRWESFHKNQGHAIKYED
jgi:hypothetical protein